MIVWGIRERFREASLVSLIDEYSANKKKLTKVELNYHSDIGVHLDIAKYLNIIGRIFESIKLSMRGINWKMSKRCMEVLSSSYFLVTRPGLAA